MARMLASSLALKTDRGSIWSIKTCKCTYHVTIEEPEIRLTGPGVEETYIIGDDIPEDLSYEGMANVAVLFWEEGEER